MTTRKHRLGRPPLPADKRRSGKAWIRCRPQDQSALQQLLEETRKDREARG